MSKLMISLFAMATATLWLVPHPQDNETPPPLKSGEMKLIPTQLPTGEMAIIRETPDGTRIIEPIRQQQPGGFGGSGQHAIGVNTFGNPFVSSPNRTNQPGSPLQSAIKAYREASGEEKSGKRDDVKTELSKQYDEFLGQQQQQIEQLKERIAKLEEQLERRREAKDRMVELKLEMTLSEADGLGWPSGNSFDWQRSQGLAYPQPPAPPASGVRYNTPATIPSLPGPPKSSPGGSAPR
jgi:hypothetical protein